MLDTAKRKICIFCKKEFYVQPYRFLKAKYCSKKCYGKSNISPITIKEKNKAQYIWCQIKSRAKSKNLSFCSLEQFKDWYKENSNCEYCGLPEKLCFLKYNRRLEIDRKFAKQGYDLNNLALSCHKCNTVKNDILTYEEMKEIGQKYLKPKWQEATYVN